MLEKIHLLHTSSRLLFGLFRGAGPGFREFSSHIKLILEITLKSIGAVPKTLLNLYGVQYTLVLEIVVADLVH